MSKKITKIKSALTGEEFELDIVSIKETLVVELKAPSAIDWTQYSVVVNDTTAGQAQTVVLDSSGIAIFQIYYGHSYTVTIPTVLVYLAPSTFTFTAGQPERILRYSYAMDGVFGIDADGVYYSTTEIQAMTTEEKAKIIYGGFNNSVLNAAQRLDGSVGCGFMWKIGEENIGSYSWASSNIEFSQELLPFVTSDAMGLNHNDGHNNTLRIQSEASRLNTASPMANACLNKTIIVGGKVKQGFNPAYGQIRRLVINRTIFEAFYTALGAAAPTIQSGAWWTSCQINASNAVSLRNEALSLDFFKSFSFSVFCAYDL